jgi:hypothetical protein
MAAPDAYLGCLKKEMNKKRGYGDKKISAAADEYQRLAERNLASGMALTDARDTAMNTILTRLDAAGQEKKDKLFATAKLLSDHEARLRSTSAVKTWAGTVASKIGVGLKSLLESDLRLPASNFNFMAIRDIAEKRMFRMFNETIESASKNWLGQQRGNTTMREFAAEIMKPGSTNNPVAKSFADAWRQRDAFFMSEMKRFGITVSPVDGQMVFHPVAAKLPPKAEFIADMKNNMDLNKSGGGAIIRENELDDWLGKYYDGIRKGNFNDLPKAFEQTGGQFTRDFANDRMIQFKDADAYAAMHEKYMNGDFLYTHAQSTKKLAHNMALAQVLGPSPVHMEGTLIKMAKDLAAELTPAGSNVKAIDKQIRRFQTMMDMALHRNAMDPESAIGMWTTAISNFQQGAMLGGSVFASLPGDMATMIATRMINHEPVLAALAAIPKALIMSKATQREMLMFGHGASEYTNQIVHEARFNSMAEYTTTPFRWGADKVLRLTGMPRAFEAVRAADMMARSKSLFEHMNTPYDQLAERDMLARWDVTAKDWQATQKAMQTGNNYSPADGIGMFRPLDHADALGPELTQKWQLLMHNEGKRNVIETTLEARAIATAGLRPDTWAGFLLSSAGRFHSYALTQGLALARTIMEADTVGGKMAIAARSGLALIVLTAMGLQVRDYMQGKQFADIRNPKFWARAVFASGAFGYWGDVTNGAVRADPASAVLNTIGGPYVKMMGDAIALSMGSAFANMDVNEASGTWTAGKAGVHLVDFFRQNLIPAPFFIKPLLDRHILEPLQEAMDPKLMAQRYAGQISHAIAAGTPYRKGNEPGTRGSIIPGF